MNLHRLRVDMRFERGGIVRKWWQLNRHGRLLDCLMMLSFEYHQMRGFSRAIFCRSLTRRE
jgi:hypothetical protein